MIFLDDGTDFINYVKESIAFIILKTIKLKTKKARNT